MTKFDIGMEETPADILESFKRIRQAVKGDIYGTVHIADVGRLNEIIIRLEAEVEKPSDVDYDGAIKAMRDPYGIKQAAAEAHQDILEESPSVRELVAAQGNIKCINCRTLIYQPPNSRTWYHDGTGITNCMYSNGRDADPGVIAYAVHQVEDDECANCGLAIHFSQTGVTWYHVADNKMWCATNKDTTSAVPKGVKKS